MPMCRLLTPPVPYSGLAALARSGALPVAKNGKEWAPGAGSGHSGLPPTWWLRYVPVGWKSVSAVWVAHIRKNTLTLSDVSGAWPRSRTLAMAKL